MTMIDSISGPPAGTLPGLNAADLDETRRAPAQPTAPGKPVDQLSVDLSAVETAALVNGADPAFLGLVQAAQTSLSIDTVDILV